jgi:hypothetical protein
VILALLLACSGADEPEDPFADQFPGANDPCVAPLVELVKWRDGLGVDLMFGKQHLTADQIATQESEHVNTAVTQLAPLLAKCRMTWNVGSFNVPRSPADRLREETVGILLGAPPQTFEPELIGPAGRSVRGG